jgi:CHASE2 domain-containing sensor protein
MKKPLHKHIGHHAKNFRTHFTKYLYERDTIFATVWVFIFIVVLGNIPLNLGVINPIKLSLKDFDSNDMSYSKLGKAKTAPIDKRIVIVNIGDADREGLSLMIDKAGSLKPKVMALDAYFDGPGDEPHKDSLLMETFRRNKNLVAATRLEFSGKEGDTIIPKGKYINTANKYAYVNFFDDQLSTIRTYEPFVADYAKKEYTSFSAAIVEAYNKEAYEKLEEKGHQRIVINYERHADRYLIMNIDDLMSRNDDDTILKDKIVLFGYITENPTDITDRFFTPMNSRFYGKSIPDMNGIVVHANIISMALDKNYIKKLPSWANVLIAVLICWLHMSFFVRYYLESHIWFHLVAKIAQVLSAIFFVWLGIYLFDQYRLKVDLKLSLIVIVMAVDVIYFYEAWAVWMHKKYKYHTVFKPHQH